MSSPLSAAQSADMASQSTGHKIWILPATSIFSTSVSQRESRNINSEIKYLRFLEKLLYRVSQNKVCRGYKLFHNCLYPLYFNFHFIDFQSHDLEDWETLEALLWVCSSLCLSQKIIRFKSMNLNSFLEWQKLLDIFESNLDFKNIIKRLAKWLKT